MSYWGKVRTKGTGKAGHRSSRYDGRAVVKLYARKARRQDDKRAVRP